MEIEESLSDLNSKRTGLGQEEAIRRLVEFGPNELKKEKGKSPLRLLLEQFKNILEIGRAHV